MKTRTHNYLLDVEATQEGDIFNFEQVYAIADMYGNNDERICDAAKALGADETALASWFNACVFIARQVQAQIEREAAK